MSAVAENACDSVLREFIERVNKKGSGDAWMCGYLRGQLTVLRCLGTASKDLVDEAERALAAFKETP